MQRTVVINVVGLSDSLINESSPNIQRLARQGGQAPIRPSFPAVTCTAQADYVTGKRPKDHGIVGNGWYNRDLAEVQFWKQPDRLVQSKKIWEDLREQDPQFTCAKLFWWYNMHGAVDYSITPRPMYPADGRKIFDIYSWPYSIRTEIKQDLGEFPFTTFWGPAAGWRSSQGTSDAVSRWIAESAKWIEKRYQPTLSLVYLPHLDYNLQRLGPADPRIQEDVRQIDSIVGDLVDFFQAKGVSVVLLSEYGISPVDTPVHLNRVFREQGWIVAKEELGLEILDCGASRAFAVADHQVAHIYLNDASLESAARQVIEKQDGVERVVGPEEKASWGIDHPRAGDLIAIAKENAWFTYYYWMDDKRAPDFARCVDIHRKPGYDPVELFVDPNLRFPRLHVARRLLQKKLGFRMLMDVIPLDATLVQGSHGRSTPEWSEAPVILTDKPGLLPQKPIEATEVYSLIRAAVTG